MGDQLSPVRIAGVAVVLFFGVLLGVGIHHLVATGTCSSTGYSANYGPVPHCPAGTGWWFAFVFAGIIGCLIGAAMASSTGLVFASSFGAIGIGALTLAFDSSARSSTRVFGGAFGGAFALVGITAGVIVLAGAMKSLRSGTGSHDVRYGKTKTSTRGAGTPPSASPSASPSPLSGTATATANSSGSTMGVPTPTTIVTTPTALNLVPGLQAARSAATGDAVDELSRLAALHERGGLTDEEFASAKAKLLNQL